MIAPFPGQRPSSTEAILQRLERGLGPIPRARLKPKVMGLVVLNLLLLLTQMFVFGRWSAAWRARSDRPPLEASQSSEASPAAEESRATTPAPAEPADR